MMVHGYNAKDLLSSTVISIQKKTSRGDMSQSDNYRGISMCNCICKLFDVILMKKCDNVLNTSDQQFAFKQKHSTAMCSSVLIETVNYFVRVVAMCMAASLMPRRHLIRCIMESGSVY